MKTAKICHLTSAHPALDVRIFEKECVSLADQGYEVHLVVAQGESQQLKGVSITSVKATQKGRFNRMFNTAQAVCEAGLALDADIYHLHDPELLRFALKLKRRGKVVIYDAHEDLPRQIMGKYWIPKYLRSIASRVVEALENFVVRRLSAVVVATPFIAERFKPLNSETVVVHNFPKQEGEFIAPSFDKKQVCYAGGITKNRGVDVLVEALSFLPEDYKLLLAGKYSPEQFRAELTEINGWEQVEGKGFIGRNEVKEMVSQSIAGLVTLRPLPNYLDALPIKMFEYMQAGLPVIASDFPYWRTLVEDQGIGVCVNPEDPKAIASAIQRFANDPALAREMGERGRKLVTEKYNWEQEAIVLGELYQRLSA